MLVSLDPFRRCRHAKALTQRGDGTNDCYPARVISRAPHEGLVDLDLVEGKAAQIGQRRVAGAEVVHRNTHSDGARLVEHVESHRLIAEQHAFCNFQLQAMRIEAAFGEGGQYGGN